jgi:hypothetical protein
MQKNIPLSSGAQAANHNNTGSPSSLGARALNTGQIEKATINAPTDYNGYALAPHECEDAVTVSTFTSLCKPSGTQEDVTWESLRRKLTKCDIRPNKDGRLFSLAIYAENNVYRASKNVRALGGFVVDCDESHTLNEIRAIIQSLGVRAIIYSTHSHGVPNPKKHPDAHAPGECYRVVFLFATPLSVEEWDEFWERGNLLFDGRIDACKDASRAYYSPSHTTGDGFVGEFYEGRSLTLEDLPPLPKDFHKATFALPSGKNLELPGNDFSERATNEDTAAILEKHGWIVERSDSSAWYVTRPGKDDSGISGNIGFHRPGNLYIFSTNAQPFEAEHAYTPWRVLGLLEHNGDFGAAARDLAQRGFGSARTEGDGIRPQIDADEADAKIYAPLCWDALSQANADNPRLFRIGGSIVRLEVEDGSPSLRSVTEDVLTHELARAATFSKKKAKGRDQDDNPLTFGVHPPKHYVRDMLADASPPLPYLRRIVASPVFAEDGTLQTEPGYHAASQTFYHPAEGLVIPPVPENPTDADITHAVDLIRRPLNDFPFVSPADRTSAIAFALTLFCRDLIKGPTPLGDIEATGPGTGKGLLADTILIPAVGQSTSVMTQWGDEEECRKRITAVLKTGKAAVLLDNVTKPLSSGTFAAALTALDWEDRMMASHEMRSFLVRCVWLMTANNPVMSTEIARRCVRIRLDAKCERAWQRDDFSIPNLREWLQKHRGELIAAYLTLVKAWFAKGRPKGKTRMGSYEDWSSVIGGILDVAGQPDFLTNLQEFYDVADIEGAAWRGLVEAWYEAHQTDEVPSATLLAIALEIDGFPINSKTERGQRTAFGTALSQKRDSIINGFQIVEVGLTRNKARLWALKPTESRPEPSSRPETADSILPAINTAEPEEPAEPFDTPQIREKTENSISLHRAATLKGSACPAGSARTIVSEATWCQRAYSQQPPKGQNTRNWNYIDSGCDSELFQHSPEGKCQVHLDMEKFYERELTLEEGLAILYSTS